MVSFKEIIKKMKYGKGKDMVCKEVTAIVAWTEIYSVIKGHCQAYSQKNRCLSLDQYLKLTKNIYYG